MGNAPMAEFDVAMPHRVGRYEVVLPIGSDERANVYLARAHGTEEPYYAVKVLARLHPNFASTLLEAGKAVLTLRHRNVIHLVDLGECERGVYLAMEYVPGESLAELTRIGRPLGRASVLRILTDVLAGLHALHEHADVETGPLGLFHGGLSARDVLVGTDGIARISGFGIARATDDQGLLGEIWRGRSPEQTAARVPYDRRCDVWAAGAIAWELLAGSSLDASAPAPNLRTLVSDLPEELAAAVGRALEPDRDRRTKDAETFARELAAAAGAHGERISDAADITEQVDLIARPKLADRKARLAEARRLQQTRPVSMPDVRTMIGGVGPPLLKRLPLADLPSQPPAHDDGASELRIAVALDQRRPADRANLDVLGPPSSPPPAEEPAGVFRSPLAIGDAEPTSPGGLASVRRGIFRWIESPWTTRKISIAAGVGCGLLGFFVVLAFASRGRPDKATAEAAASAFPTATSSSPAALIGSAQPSAPSASAGESSESADAPLLHLSANAPIASVQVGGRVIDSVVPAPAVSIDLTGAEPSSALRLVVTSTDGRVATLTTNAGDLEIEVVFGDKPKPIPSRRPKAAPASTVKHPWSKH